VALTKFNFNSFDLTTAASKGLAFNSSANGFETATEGSVVLIKTLTASTSSTLSFVHGSSDVVLDSTYPVYLFKFINIHPGTDDANFQFDTSDDTGSSYDTTKTTTSFRAKNAEDDSTEGLAYRANADLAQGATYQTIAENLDTDNDSNGCGEMYLFNPSSTTFVKHFLCRFTNYNNSEAGNQDQFTGGYINVTAAIDAVLFRFHTGNIDSGTIKLYGIKDS
jgi:hypothetical protein